MQDLQEAYHEEEETTWAVFGWCCEEIREGWKDESPRRTPAEGDSGISFEILPYSCQVAHQIRSFLDPTFGV